MGKNNRFTGKNEIKKLDSLSLIISAERSKKQSQQSSSLGRAASSLSRHPRTYLLHIYRIIKTVKLWELCEPGFYHSGGARCFDYAALQQTNDVTCWDTMRRTKKQADNDFVKIYTPWQFFHNISKNHDHEQVLIESGPFSHVGESRGRLCRRGNMPAVIIIINL